jgi:hypothetical protein
MALLFSKKGKREDPSGFEIRCAEMDQLANMDIILAQGSVHVHRILVYLALSV